MFNLSVHPAIIGKPAAWSASFADGWQQVCVDLAGLRESISSGVAFIPAAMSSAHRSSSAFVSAQLVVADIDGGYSPIALLEHPLTKEAFGIYTTPSHDPDTGNFRFRVLFALDQPISDPDLYQALVRRVIRTYRSDGSCSDPCRLFYGNPAATWPRWEPERRLDPSWIESARLDLAALISGSTDVDIDEITLEQAAYCLEHVLPPTCDGQRDLFTRITAAARAAGDLLFGPWSNWASSGHHGKGKNARQASERFFRGFSGSSLGTLFFLASEADPEWRSKLPDHLRSSRPFDPQLPAGVAGYGHDDFLDEDPDLPIAAPADQTVSLFDQPPAAAAETSCEEPTDQPEAQPFDPLAVAIDDDLEPDDAPPAGLPAPPRGRGGGGGGNGGNGRRGNADQIEEIMARLKVLYPGLRLNTMNQQLEFTDPATGRSTSIPDASTAYVRVSRGSGQVFGKSLVYDLAQVIAWEHRYHPVRAYLEHCASTAEPIDYLDTFASTLLGLPDDPITNPRLDNGELLADVILRRFLIGAVARVYEPGCRHDWMPILIGSQNVGKSTFFQYLTPDIPANPGTYPWCATMQQGISYLKERPHMLHAGWIVVLDEIERYFRRQFTEELKNLISTPVDRSARKYENERDFPRGFVLAGAANNADFLVDPTGNRRFLPIVVTGVVPSPDNPAIKIIDLDRLKAQRESIWAAAYKAYLDKPVHNFSSHELALIADYQETFSADSAIDARLSRKLEMNNSGIWRGHFYVTLSDVFEWLDIPLTAQPSMNIPVADSLKRAGYRMRRVSIGGKTKRIWLKLSDEELAAEFAAAAQAVAA